MLVNPCLTSSTMAGSSHYQPGCVYYTSTSSALIKINMLRYHFMFAPFSLDPCLNTEPETGFQHWTNLLHGSRVGVLSFPLPYLISLSLCGKDPPPNFPAFTSHSFCSLILGCLFSACQRQNTTVKDAKTGGQQKVCDGYHNRNVRQSKQMQF